MPSLKEARGMPHKAGHDSEGATTMKNTKTNKPSKAKKKEKQ